VPVRLSDLPRYTPATVQRVEAAYSNDAIAQRLADLGFVPGESVRLTATGPVGQDPILVQIGFTRFALRRTEADRVLVEINA